LNALKITNFIVICQAIVDKAQAIGQVRMPQPGTFPELLDMFTAFFGLAPEIARYVRERIQKFHPERLLHPAA
jgi:hypothetical protein